MQVSDSSIPARRRERERVQRRSAMLDAARQVFGAKGYAGATLDDIAVAAEYGKGTLYNYFPGGKEELLLAVVEAVHDELCALIESSFPDPDPRPVREQFRSFLEGSLAHFSVHQSLFAVLMKEAHRMALSERPERVRFFIRQRSRVAGALAVPLRRAMDRGELRLLPPDSVAHMLLGNLQGCQMLLSVHGCAEGGTDHAAWTSADAAQFLTTLLFDGLLTRHPLNQDPSP